MTILVCGSRDYTDAAKVMAALVTASWRAPHTVPTVIHGANGRRDRNGKVIRGADLLAHDAALYLGFDVDPHPADWDKHGRAAGPIRNRQMLDTKPDLVIAFGHGRGTSDTVTEARKRGIPVVRYS